MIAPSQSVHSGFFTHNGIRIFGVSSYPIPKTKDFRFSVPFFQKNKIRKVIEDFGHDVAHLQSHFYINKAVFEISQKLKIPVTGTNHFMPENLLHYLHLPKKFETIVKNIASKYVSRKLKNYSKHCIDFIIKEFENAYS